MRLLYKCWKRVKIITNIFVDVKVQNILDWVIVLRIHNSPTSPNWCFGLSKIYRLSTWHRIHVARLRQFHYTFLHSWMFFDDFTLSCLSLVFFAVRILLELFFFLIVKTDVHRRSLYIYIHIWIEEIVESLHNILFISV